MMDTPHEFGTFYSHNITKHPEKGLGRYSDGELAYLLRTGVRKDGIFTGPMMASPFLSDEDLASIIAFLRSDDPWVKATDVEDKQSETAFLMRFLMHVAFKQVPLPKAPIPTPSLSDSVAYGRYVVHALGDCFVCHSESFKTLKQLEPEQSGGYLGGGNALKDAGGNTVYGSNLTLDPETGIGKWSEEDFVYAVRTGIRKDGRALRYPMVPFGELSEAEVRAVWAYLKTVPVIKNPVPRAPDPPPAVAGAGDGARLYQKYACGSCHGPTGVGVCDLRNASKTYDTDDKLSAFIHDPSKFVPGTKMPTWGGVISEADYPALIAYVHALGKGEAPATH
jgi:mono/diheme cytochrome c family protein